MLGLEVPERTVTRYMPERPVDPDARRRWMTFLRNHRDGIAAMDFFIVPTVTFQVLYVFFVIHHARRKILHVGFGRDVCAACPEAGHFSRAQLGSFSLAAKPQGPAQAR